MSAPCSALGLLFTQFLGENLSVLLPRVFHSDFCFTLDSVVVGDAAAGGRRLSLRRGRVHCAPELGCGLANGLAPPSILVVGRALCLPRPLPQLQWIASK